MKTQFMKFTLAASIGLALAFTFSCSGDDGGGSSSSGNGDPNNPFAGNPEYEWMKEEVKYYDPSDESQKCESGIVQEKCGEAWINPLTHVCIIRKCDENDHDCVPELGTIELCGSQLYVSYSEGRCKNGVLEGKCDNGEWYNRKTHYCENSDYPPGVDCTVTAKTRCGNEYYYPDEDYTRCKAGVIEEKCGHGETESWYNPKIHYCSYSYSNGTSTHTLKPIERCGLLEIDDDYERCNNKVYEESCGSPSNENAVWYNPITQSCDRDNGYTIKNKTRCGG